MNGVEKRTLHCKFAPVDDFYRKVLLLVKQSKHPTTSTFLLVMYFCPA